MVGWGGKGKERRERGIERGKRERKREGKGRKGDWEKNRRQ